MNRGRAFAAFVAFAALAGGCTGESEQSRYEAAIPEAGEFERLELSYAGPWRSLADVFEANEVEDPATVRAVLGWLSEGRVAGISSDASTYQPLNSQPIARFRNDSADALEVAPAYNCTTTELSEHCRTHPRHVVVRHGEDAWRVVSPELAEWLSSQFR